jgi:hypothetical protein
MIDVTLTTEKVVIHKPDSVVKGFYETSLFQNLAQTVRQRYGTIPESVQLRLPASDERIEVSLEDAKAVFFVKEFDGKKARKDLNFHQNTPLNEGVWVQLQFTDGEILEGLIYNSIFPLIEPGFFLIPTDPGSNNRLIYVLKHALSNFRVLGLRPL